MAPSSTRPDREDRLGAALIAAAAAEPTLLQPLQVAADRWQSRLEDDGLDPTVATVLRLACDGLWLCDLFGLAPPSATLRAGRRARARAPGIGSVMTGTTGVGPSHGTVRPTAPRADQSVRLIRTLTVTVFLQWMGATAIVPMLPVYIRHLHGSDALAGVVMARSSPPACSPSTRWVGWPTGSGDARC